MHLLTDLSEGYWNKDVEEFLANLEAACQLLDVLGQIQACAGTQMMQGRAKQTDELCIKLQMQIPELRKHAKADYERMRKVR